MTNRDMFERAAFCRAFRNIFSDLFLANYVEHIDVQEQVESDLYDRDRIGGRLIFLRADGTRR